MSVCHAPSNFCSTRPDVRSCQSVYDCVIKTKEVRYTICSTAMSLTSVLGYCNTRSQTIQCIRPTGISAATYIACDYALPISCSDIDAIINALAKPTTIHSPPSTQNAPCPIQTCIFRQSPASATILASVCPPTP